MAFAQINTGVKKVGEYYQAVLIIPYGLRTRRYYSKDVFIDIKTARKQAEWWAYESKLTGQVIDY